MKITRKLQLYTLFTLLTLVSACTNHHTSKETKSIDPLISAQWLNKHLNDSDLVVLDSSVIVNMNASGGFNLESGLEQFNQGHIPKARFADLKGNLSKTMSELNFVMPTAMQFQSVMQKLGVGNNTRVVIYSVDNQDWATRLWWMLRWAGVDQVAILDGGLKAWTAAGFTLSNEISKQTENVLILKLRPQVIAYEKEVLTSINNKQVNLFDAMPEMHFLGQFSMYSRPGHINGAINIPSSSVIAESGLFKPMDELDMMFDQDKKHRSIAYCGGGVSASTVAFTLYRLGYEDVAVYMGSLQEWAENPENPMTVLQE